MKITYRNNKIKKKLSSASEIIKAFGKMAKKVQQRLDEIESSDNLDVLMKIPAANCHPLKGGRKDEWALDISGNYRLIFDIDHDPVPVVDSGEIDAISITDITIIEAIDYH